MARCQWCGGENGQHGLFCGPIKKEAINPAPKPPDILHLFPDLSAKDLFCHRCVRVMRYTLKHNISMETVKMAWTCHGRDCYAEVQAKHVEQDPADVKKQVLEIIQDFLRHDGL